MSGLTGFGFNLLSLPLLAVAYEPHHAVVVGLLVGVLVFGLVLLIPGVWGQMDVGLVRIIFLSSLIGQPIGAFLLSVADARTLRMAIGGIAFSYAVGQLLGVLPQMPASRRVAPLVGVAAGILATSVTMGGTVVILYLLSQGRQKGDLRATSVGYVFLSTIAACITLALAGLVTREALADAVSLAPASVLGFLAGAVIFRFVPSPAFLRLTLILLALVGLIALVAAFR